MTVEASSALGNVGTVLGGVLGGGAAAASDVSGSADYTISIGKTVTINGSGYGFGDSWESNEESVATVSGRGSSATVTGKGAGTAVITHTYGTFASKEETFTVVVQPATPAQAISISGSDTVTQFSSIQLTATVDPAEATGTYAWSSSNEDILTVDNSGNVTGVRQGTATVTVSFRSAADGSVVSASKDVTVTATEEATDRALVYYLVDPTKDANSNDSGNWGANSLGTARVNTTGATWTGGKNCFDNVDQRVVSWPNGTNVVPRDSDAWNEIFNNYRTTIQAQLPGVTFTKDDVEEIALVPAKISKNNGTNPDMHLDCNVSIKCKNVSLVKYYLRDAGSTQFVQKGAKNYISGNTTEPSDVMNEQFPETKTVDGVTYTFSGWYLDQSFTQPATFPYAVNSSTNFYAKYVGGFQVTYNLAGGSWSNSDATTYIAQEGSTQTVKSEPTREGYKFTGWTIEGLPDTTALKSGDIFAMPAGNVTITANWQELLSYQVKYLEKGTEKQLADPDTRYGEQGDKVSADAKTIDGYHPTDPSHIEKTLESSDNDIIFWYEKDSVEYTVNYYLNDTEQKVADSETKSAPWGTQVKASDLAKDIDGYTAVPNQDATITVDLNGNNSINVYYYQNVSLKAKSAEVTYNGNPQSVSGFEVQSASGFTGAPKGADFSGITVGANGTDAGTYSARFAEGTVGTVDKTKKYIVVSVENGSLVINKAKATIAPKDATKAYDGTDLKASEFVTEGFVKDQGVKSATFTGSQLNVGTSKSGIDGYVLADGTNANNYDITKGTGNLEVTPVSDEVTVTITGNAATLKYDGTEQSVTGYTVACSNGLYTANDFDFTGSAVAKGTNVGTYKMGLEADQFSNTSANFTNVTFVVEDGWLKIEGGQIDANDVTWTTQDVRKVYDGNPLSAFPASATDTHGNELNVEYSIDGEAWTSDPAEISLTHFGSQKVLLRATGSNYAAGQYATSSEKIAINKRPVTLTSAGANKVYDGKPLTNDTVTSTPLGVDVGFLDGEGVTCNVTGSQTNVGESDNEFTYTFNEGTSESDYLVTSNPGKLIVTQDNTEVVVTITEHSGTFEYDGTQKTVSGYDFSASNELYKNTDFEFTGNDSVSATNVGTYDMELKSENFKNTNGNFSKVTFVVVDGQLTITPKSVDPEAGKGMSVGKLPHVTYNGKSQKQKPEVKDGNTLLTEGTDYTLVYSKDTTNVGTVTVTVEGKGNYAGEAEVTYEILKRQVTLESASASKVYDGTPLTKPEVTVGGDGFVEGEVSGLKAIGTVTNVADGEVDNEIVWDWAEGFGEGNYDITKTEGKLSIEPQSIDPSNPESYTGIKVGELSNLVYNGEDQLQEPTVTDAKGDLLVKNRDYTLAFDGDAKNVTEAGVSVTVSGIGNYKGDFSRSYKILPREVTVKSASASKAYDGTPLTKHEAGVTEGSMVDGESFVYEFTGIQTIAGESANSFIISAGDGTNLDNYEITKQEGTLKVEPKGIVPGEDNGMKVTKPVDKVYNGKEQKFVPVVTDGDKALVENVDYVVTYTDALGFEDDAAAKDDFTNVTGDIFVTVAGIGNYAGSLTQSYQITPKPYTVTTVSGSKVCDGTPLEGASLEGNFVGGLVNDDDATFVVTGTQTEVGASDNTYTLEFVDEQMAKNYKLVKEDIGTLTVVKDESEASQNPNGNGESKNKGTLPKTSDTTLATLPFALAVVAGAALCAAPVARRRSKF